VGDTDGIVGDALGAVRVEVAPPQEGPDSERRSEKEPPRPPLDAPRDDGLYPRGPEGGINAALSARVAVDAVTGAVVEGLADGDLAGAVKFRIALGPVGALRADGPRGGDRAGGERRFSLDGSVRTGDRSLGVILSLYSNGDRS
jgi:hypothetical protein